MDRRRRETSTLGTILFNSREHFGSDHWKRHPTAKTICPRLNGYKRPRQHIIIIIWGRGVCPIRGGDLYKTKRRRTHKGLSVSYRIYHSLRLGSGKQRQAPLGEAPPGRHARALHWLNPDLLCTVCRLVPTCRVLRGYLFLNQRW